MASADPITPVQVVIEEGWLSPTQAAARLGVSTDTVRRMLDRGALRGARTVLGRVVDPASIEEVKGGR